MEHNQYYMYIPYHPYDNVDYGLLYNEAANTDVFYANSNGLSPQYQGPQQAQATFYPSQQTQAFLQPSREFHPNYVSYPPNYLPFSYMPAPAASFIPTGSYPPVSPLATPVAAVMNVPPLPYSNATPAEGAQPCNASASANINISVGISVGVSTSTTLSSGDHVNQPSSSSPHRKGRKKSSLTASTKKTRSSMSATPSRKAKKKQTKLKVPFVAIPGESSKCGVSGCSFRFCSPTEADQHYKVGHGLTNNNSGKERYYCSHEHDCGFKEGTGIKMCVGSLFRHYRAASGVALIQCQWCAKILVWRPDKTHVCKGHIPEDYQAQFEVSPARTRIRASVKKPQRRGN